MRLRDFIVNGPPAIEVHHHEQYRAGWKRNLWWFTIGGLIDWWQWRKVPWWEVGPRVTEQFHQAAEEARGEHVVRDNRIDSDG